MTNDNAGGVGAARHEKDTTMKDFRITQVDGCDGVTVNESGAWLGEVETQQLAGGALETSVVVCCDEDGDFIPAPDNWQALVVEEL